MRLLRTEIATSPLSPDFIRISGEVSYDGQRAKPEVYWFEFPRSFEKVLDARSGNSWAVCLLPLAVTLHEPLIIDLPVDRVLLSNLHELMHIWKSWYPNLGIVKIGSPIEDAEALPADRKVAAFFSGGVDAYYTALRHQDKENAEDGVVIDQLVHVWGFDIPLRNKDAYENMLSILRSGAQKLKKELLTIRTNIRETRLEYSDWGALYHGAAIATVGLFLQKHFRRILVASTFAYRDIHPWGSTHLTDPLYSTSNVTIINDGDAARYEKIAYIAHSEIARKTLHVCFMLGTDQNCSHCVKCCRTMINLELLGVLDKFTTFDRSKLTMEAISRIFSYDRFDRDVLRSLQELAREKGRQNIVAAIEQSFKHTDTIERYWHVLRELKKRTFLKRLAQVLERQLLKNTIL